MVATDTDVNPPNNCNLKGRGDNSGKRKKEKIKSED